jgi:hypothetical protein
VAGVWAVLTILTIFMGLPAILGTYLAAEYGSPRLVRIWVTVMLVSLTAALVLTAIVMFTT